MEAEAGGKGRPGTSGTKQLGLLDKIAEAAKEGLEQVMDTLSPEDEDKPISLGPLDETETRGLTFENSDSAPPDNLSDMSNISQPQPEKATITEHMPLQEFAAEENLLDNIAAPQNILLPWGFAGRAPLGMLPIWADYLIRLLMQK